MMIKNTFALKNLNKIFLFLLISIFCGCSNKSKTNILVYRAFARTLVNSNSFVTNQNTFLIKSLEKKLADPATSQKAKVWLPKALLIQKLTSDVMEYIDNLKIDLKKEAGFKMVNDREFFREEDTEPVSILFVEKGNGERLKQRILELENNLLRIDPEMDSIFKNQISRTIILSDPTENRENTFTEMFFKNIPTVAALAVLDGFQNNIKIMENELIAFCDNKVPS
jgi:GldM N-terminal domain